MPRRYLKLFSYSLGSGDDAERDVNRYADWSGDLIVSASFDSDDTDYTLAVVFETTKKGVRCRNS